MRYLMLIASLVSLFLGILVWSRNPKVSLYRSFGIFSTIASIFIFDEFIIRFFPENHFILRSAYAFGALVPALAISWALEICEEKKINFKRSLWLVVAFVFFFISFIDQLIIKGVTELGEIGFKSEGGPFFLLYSVYMACALGYLIYKLAKSYLSESGVRKKQLKFVLIGASATSMVTLFVSFVLPLFDIFSYTSLDGPSFLFFIAFTAYAMTKYKFMDFRAIILRTITFSAIILLITGVFAGLSALAGQALENALGFRSDIIVGLIVGIIIATTYQPMRKIIESVTQKFLFKKQYDRNKLLADISETSTSVLTLDSLLSSVSRILNDTLSPTVFAFALLNSKGKLEARTVKGLTLQAAQALAGGQEKVMAQVFKKWQGKILILSEIRARVDAGEYTPISPMLLSALSAVNIEVLVPLYVKDNLKGVVVMGEKKSGDLYNQQDISVLDIISDQVAIAIENAQLYDELRELNVGLENKVKERTKELSVANVKLRELDQTKSDFISIASHQLRTPLTVIKGYISMMRDGSFGKVRPKILGNLEKVYIANERLIELVENLLNISRIESGRQEFNWQRDQVEDLAAEVVEELKNNAKKRGLKLSFVKPKKLLPKVLIDRNKLHEVMMNFTDNAIKYTPKGSVKVFVEEDKDGMIEFYVKDTGMGINPETLPYLFQKFSRGKGSFKIHTEGTGLGLYVARMIVEAHHGIIGAESIGNGKGSRFFFRIPVEGPKSKGYKLQEPIRNSLDEGKK